MKRPGKLEDNGSVSNSLLSSGAVTQSNGKVYSAESLHLFKDITCETG